MTARPSRSLPVLIALLLATAPTAADDPRITTTGQPLRVWEVDFSDPSEPGRWKRLPTGGDAPVSWEAMTGDPGDPARGHALRFRAAPDLAVQASAWIHREFPEEFRVARTSVIIVEWTWRIADTDRSDWVGVGTLWTDGRSRLSKQSWAVSHTRYTVGFKVLFDEPNEWTTHRVARWPARGPQFVDRIGFLIHFLDPVGQIVDLRYLRLEEWPADAVEVESHRRRFPPPREAFAPLPPNLLGQAMSGALHDLNEDGLPELLAFQRRGYVHVYLNESGRFEREITQSLGLALPTMATGALFVDLDGDRDSDLATVGEFDTPRLYENLRPGRFVDRTPIGEDWLGFWSGLATDDVDGDGDPDLFFTDSYVGSQPLRSLRNEGDWRFSQVEWIDREELHRERRFFSVTLGDTNGDAWPEALFGKEFYFRNQRGHLEPYPDAWSPIDHSVTEGAALADLTGDGSPDLLVLRDGAEAAVFRGETVGRTRVLAGDGTGHFDDRTAAARLPRLDSAEVALVEDFDNDGDLDVYVCQRRRQNYLLLNDGKGAFEDATERSGLEDLGGCDSAVAGDLSGDGKMDVVIFRYGAPPALLRNRLDSGHWLGVVVQGRAPATDAIGGKVVAADRTSGLPILTRWIRRGRGFGSNGPSELRFGIGKRSEVDLEVVFPRGEVRKLTGIAGDRTVLVRERDGGSWSALQRAYVEARFPIARSYRRAMIRHPSIVWALVAVGLASGLLLGGTRCRWPALMLMVSGLAVVLSLGSVGWIGWPGRTTAVWIATVVIGASARPAVSGVAELVRRARRRRWSIPAEDLVRLTLDFRHAGTETRGLLSIHGRARNLFLADELHRGFLEELVELCRRFRRTTEPGLRKLVDAAQAALADLEVAGRLSQRIDALARILEELPSLGLDVGRLRHWRKRALPLLDETKECVDELLDVIDRHCSCDVGQVVEEVRSMRREALRESGTEIVFRRAGSPRAVVTHSDLVLVLDNLFSNATHAMRDRSERRIEIDLSSDGKRVKLEFRDTGPGLPDGDEDRAFRYGHSTRPGGQGYGLARSRELVGHFGGSLVYDPPTPGPGARFVLSLRATPGPTI